MTAWLAAALAATVLLIDPTTTAKENDKPAAPSLSAIAAQSPIRIDAPSFSPNRFASPASEAEATRTDEIVRFESAAYLEPLAIAPAPSVMKSVSKNPQREVHIASTGVPETKVYEVTAYYLNVRANAYSTSKIVDVVSRGTQLDVLSVTDNGWLRIKGGGYVHGEYAKLSERSAAERPAADPARATDLRAERSAAKAGPPGGPEQINEAPERPTSTVETDSGLTEKDIAVIFDGTELAGHGLEEAVLEVEEKYGINAWFTIAVMKLESGNGKSRLAKNKNNLFGLNASGSDPHRQAFSFETKTDSVMKFGQLLSDKYVDQGYTTIEKIAKKYCPANSKWSGLVKKIMNSDYKKVT